MRWSDSFVIAAVYTCANRRRSISMHSIMQTYKVCYIEKPLVFVCLFYCSHIWHSGILAFQAQNRAKNVWQGSVNEGSRCWNSNCSMTQTIHQCAQGRLLWITYRWHLCRVLSNSPEGTEDRNSATNASKNTNKKRNAYLHIVSCRFYWTYVEVHTHRHALHGMVSISCHKTKTHTQQNIWHYQWLRKEWSHVVQTVYVITFPW